MSPTETIRLSVLVIDDEKNIRRTVRLYLEDLKCRVGEAASGDEALRLLEESRFDLALLDLRLGGQSGLDLIPRLQTRDPEMAVVVITAYASVDTAVAAMKLGATDYLPKPFTPAHLTQLVDKATERLGLRLELADLKSQLSSSMPELDFETDSAAMKTALEGIDRAAPHSVPVLFRGENGTGKGVLARWLHGKSPRHARPFVLVNCPTLSEELLASELFGHAKGAFTGAVKDAAGKVEAAEGGTLFLDEIGELSASLQSKLLRFLQDKEFERVGETRTRRADVRVVTATNRDLDSDVAAGRFREDLFYRLNTVEITVPPLRERPEDIGRLALRFARFMAKSTNYPEPQFTPEAQQLLLSYPWPGNVRELRNAVERAVIFARGPLIGPEEFPARLLPAQPGAPQVGGAHSLEEIERAHINQVVAKAPTQEEAARILGIDVSTLWRKRKRERAQD